MGQFSMGFVRWNARRNFRVFFFWKTGPVLPENIFGPTFCFIGCYLPWNWRSRRNFEKKMKIANFRSQKCPKNYLILADYRAKSTETRRLFECFWLLTFVIFIFFSKFLRECRFKGKWHPTKQKRNQKNHFPVTCGRFTDKNDHFWAFLSIFEQLLSNFLSIYRFQRVRRVCQYIGKNQKSQKITKIRPKVPYEHM